MIPSLPSRERGLKYGVSLFQILSLEVAPFAGAWIEISTVREVRDAVSVAPFAGAWIEIQSHVNLYNGFFVAPFAGAWIEIYISDAPLDKPQRSLPSRERGLKYVED